MKKSITLPLYLADGTHKETVTLPEEVFSQPVADEFIVQIARAYQANVRQGTVNTRDRSEVHRTKAKLYRQKGTGRARHGSRSAPIFVGGGVTHGPDNNMNFRQSISKTMRRRAVTGILSQKVKEDKVILVQALSNLSGKTKETIKWLTLLKLNKIKSLLLLVDKVNAELLRGSANVKTLKISQVRRTNAYELMRADRVIMTPETIQALVSYVRKEI